jgi:hypothetical protein
MTNPRFNVSSPNEIMYGWTMDDVCEAHAVLDMYAELDALAARPK